MDILYISNASGNPWAGPTYTIPRQVAAQAQYDNVFWYNLQRRDDLHPAADSWRGSPFYHDLNDYPKGKVADLPMPFCKPDLIVVEQFYTFGKRIGLIHELEKGDIPYVIKPHGEFRKQAQHRRRLKKILGNVILFRYFALKAMAIEYLTEGEKEDSGRWWNKSSVVIPNGIDMPRKYKRSFLTDGIRLAFIGRLDSKNKGLDLLVEACSKIREQLSAAQCTIDVYGPANKKEPEHLMSKVSALGLQNLISFHGAIYENEKKIVLLQADAFILTSRHEGHPMSVLEALSYGLPVIVTEGTSMRRDVEDYCAGWTADNTVDSIAQALLRMLSDKGHFQEKGEGARRLAENYSWNKIARDSHEAYVQLLKSAR